MNKSNLSLSTEEIISKAKPFERQSMIYFLIKDKEIVYVGQSTIGLQRISMHGHSKDFDSYSFIDCPKDKLNNVETYYILKLSPKYNKTLPQNDVIKSKEVIKRDLNLRKYQINKIIKKYNIKPIMQNYYYIDIFKKILKGEVAREGCCNE